MRRLARCRQSGTGSSESRRVRRIPRLHISPSAARSRLAGGVVTSIHSGTRRDSDGSETLSRLRLQVVRTRTCASWRRKKPERRGGNAGGGGAGGESDAGDPPSKPVKNLSHPR